MDQTRFLQRVRMNQFERVYRRWKEKKLTQAEAAERLGITERTFRRYTVRYRDEGMQGLLDKRLGAVSHNRASQQESSEVVALSTRVFTRTVTWLTSMKRTQRDTEAAGATTG